MTVVNSHVLAPAAKTVAGDTGALDNLSRSALPVVVVEINCTAISGAGASLTPTLEGSSDGGATWFVLQAGTAISAIGKQRLAVQNVLESKVRVSWPLPAGTTPSVTVGFTLLFN